MTAAGERGDGGLGGFGVGRQAERAQGLRGDGADGDAEDLRRQGEAGGSSRANRLVTVELLVKVMASG